jgi:dienelactone hydrolase
VRPRGIVVFIHGWTATTPFMWHRRRLDHIAAQGNIVVFPRYQPGDVGDPQPPIVEALRSGLTAAFAHLRGTRLPVTAVGYSVGGMLAFVYADEAKRWGVPPPDGIFSIFPAVLQGVPVPSLKELAPTVPVVIQTGDLDTTVSTTGADAVWPRLAHHPRAYKRYERLVSTRAYLIMHEAPKGYDRTTTRTFWTPIDELVAQVDRRRR